MQCTPTYSTPSEAYTSESNVMVTEVVLDSSVAEDTTISDPEGTMPLDYTSEWDTLNLILRMGDQALGKPSQIDPYTTVPAALEYDINYQ